MMSMRTPVLVGPVAGPTAQRRPRFPRPPASYARPRRLVNHRGTTRHSMTEHAFAVLTRGFRRIGWSDGHGARTARAGPTPGAREGRLPGARRAALGGTWRLRRRAGHRRVPSARAG